MFLYRRFEEKAEEAYAIGKIGGFCPPAHRTGRTGRRLDQGNAPRRPRSLPPTGTTRWPSPRGWSPRSAMAELYGRADGCSGGRGGSIAPLRRLGRLLRRATASSAARFPSARGWAGRSGTGAATRSASATWVTRPSTRACFWNHSTCRRFWQLPVIYVVENNGYGMGTAFFASVGHRHGGPLGCLRGSRPTP